MTKSLKLEVLNNIGLVYQLSEDSKLENTFFDLVDAELSFLADYFHVTKSQALIISIILTVNFTGRNVDLEDLNRHFDCNPMKLLEYSDDFVELYKKGIIRTKKMSGLLLKLSRSNDSFFVNEIVSEIILKSEPFPQELIDNENFEDVFNLLEKLYELSEQISSDEITTKEIFKQTKVILNRNTHFPLVDKVNSFVATIEEKYLFLYMVCLFLDGDRIPWVERTFKKIYDRANDRYSQLQRLLAKQNNLIIEEWIELDDAIFFNDTRMKFTEKSLDLLNECGLKIFNKDFDKKKMDNVILPNDVPFRNLIFNDNEAQQLDLLKNLLNDENFKHTQERLIQKALPKGVTVLLHGLPGTGKTESVLQIAKATNREIMKVDISASRSMWFGESEKLIKQVFKDYKSYMNKQKLVPILFFNEADAIISKRKDLGSSNVSDTENRIQNILLEEIENFEGIFIATTNLSKNMDSAFERRFLFKIEFQKPSVASKAQIWQAKIPELSSEDCELLASQFDFSGGQIDNIVRKNEINEIIYGQKVNVKTLIDFCKEETLNNQYSKKAIGFKTK